MFLRLHELQIHYKVFGAGESIIFLPGWGASIDCYTKLCEHLAKRFQVFAIDLPGSGLSSAPSAVWGTMEYAELVADFVSRLKIQTPILIGHSFGGKIALYLAAKQLVNPKKMLLISSSGIRLPRTLTQRFRMYFYKIFKEIASLPIFRLFLSAILEKYKNKTGSEDYRNARGIMRSILVKQINEDIRDLLPLIKSEVLLIWGDKDTSTPIAAGKIMHALLTISRLEIINGAGHFPHLDDFGKFIAILDDFFK